MKQADMRDILKKYWAEVVLCILFIATLIYNLIWLGMNKAPSFMGLVSISNYYPPFYHFSTAVMYLFFGKSMNTAILTNTVFTEYSSHQSMGSEKSSSIKRRGSLRRS